jgi:hypothetical protein
LARDDAGGAGLLGLVAGLPGFVEGLVAVVVGVVDDGVEPEAALAAAGIAPIAHTAAPHANRRTNPLVITAGSKSLRARR